MATNVRAKFQVMTVQPHPTVGDPQYAQVTLRAVYGDGEDNRTWSKATPSGQLDMMITNMDAVAAFEVGKAYFLDFTPAD